MSKFWMNHPIIALIMMGMVCATIVETADIVANGKRSPLPLKKKENTQENVESVEE